MIPLSERDDYIPSYTEFTIKTDKEFSSKYGLLTRYKCQTCGHEWEEKPGFVFCPKDQYHDYITWVNYDKVVNLTWEGQEVNV